MSPAAGVSYTYASGISPVIVYFVVRLVVAWLRAGRAGKGGPKVITLKIPRVLTAAPVRAVEAPAPRTTLCTGCVYAHIVRGYEPGEELIFCGYAYPQRQVLFPVRECTDYRPKRERNGVEVEIEGAVSLLPLEKKAADFCAVAAARNGEGEDESSDR